MKQKSPEDFNWEEQVGAKPLRLRPQSQSAANFMGYLVSQIVGFGALGLVTLIFSHFDFQKLSDLGSWTAGILGFSQFFLVPFGMGIVASYFWINPEKNDTAGFLTQGKRLNAYRPIHGSSFLNTLLSCVGAGFVLKEGVICLLMASPNLWAFMDLGVQTGAHFWRKNPFLGVSLVPLLLLVVFAEAGRSQPKTFVVSTDFHARASPAALWQYTANYPRNPHPPGWWLYRLGLPAPLQSTGAAEVGGRRDCVLDGGVKIGEKVVVAERNRKLEFVIDRQPQHPEIAHHFILERGRIELFPDGQGGTLLRGTSWYRLNVAPVAYFDLWGAQIVHQTHLRVFRWMEELALTRK